MSDTVYYKEKNVKAYRIVMSRGDDIPFDEDELQKVYNAISSGQPAMLRQGLFNPSFYVSIIFDEKRVMEFIREFNETVRHNEQQKMYHDGQNLKQLPGFQPLKDIFAGTKLAKMIEAKKQDQLPQGQPKQLTK